MPMEMDHLTDRMGSKPNLSIRRSITIHTMVNVVNGHGHGNRNGYVNRPQIFVSMMNILTASEWGSRPHSVCQRHHHR